MEKFYFILFSILCSTFSWADIFTHTLSSSASYTGASVSSGLSTACSGGGGSCTGAGTDTVRLLISDGVDAALNGDWDLTSFTTVYLQLEGDGSRLNFDNSNEDVLMSSTSFLRIDPTNTDGLDANNTGNVRISFGGTEYKKGNFTAIIAAGGATENGPEDPLPVELTSFSGSYENDMIVLSWSTVSELNNDFFEVERSTDLEHIERIGIVQGTGTTFETQNYTFSDHVVPSEEYIYYRLVQTDFDGTEHLSNWIAVNINDHSLAINVYPNPFSEGVIVVGGEGTFNYSIVSKNGTETDSGIASFNQEIPLNHLPKGNYHVKIRHESSSEVIRIVRN